MPIPRLKKRIKKHFIEVLKIKHTPNSIALGFALGTFIAISPTFGFGILIGMIILLFFKNISKLSMLAAFIVWNPLLLMPVYLLSYKLGDILLDNVPPIKFNIVFLNQIYDLSARFLVGNMIISVSFSLMFYILIRYFARKYQEKLKSD